MRCSTEEVAAAAAAHAYESSVDALASILEDEAEGYDTSEARIDFDEDEVEIERLRYKQALKRLAAAFPELELDVPALLGDVRANEHNSRACPCGDGRLIQWPWLLHRARMGFCACHESGYYVVCERQKWIPQDMPW